MVGFLPCCTNRLRKHGSHLVGSSFLAVKAVSALNGCLVAENAKQSLLMSRRVRVTSLLIIAASALWLFWGQGLNRNENMVCCRHAYAKK